MLSIKVLGILLLGSCVLLCPTKLFGYAWERGKGKKYIEYGITFDPGYRTAFHYDISPNSSIRFEDSTKKLVLSRYYERGLSDRFTLISKVEIQRISSKLHVNVKEEVDNKFTQNITKPYIPKQSHLKDFKANTNFTAIDYEIGIRTLLHKWNNQRVSCDIILGLPAAIQGEGGANVVNPSLKLGVSYAKTFDLFSLKGNFFEVMLANKLNPEIKKKESFITVVLGLKPSEKISLLFGFENNYLYKNSFERHVFTNIYKKIATKNIDEELKEKLKSHIEKHSLLDEKKIERKIQARIAYKIAKNYELCFDYFFRFSKNAKPHIVKFSLVKHLY